MTNHWRPWILTQNLRRTLLPLSLCWMTPVRSLPGVLYRPLIKQLVCCCTLGNGVFCQGSWIQRGQRNTSHLTSWFFHNQRSPSSLHVWRFYFCFVTGCCYRSFSAFRGIVLWCSFRRGEGSSQFASPLPEFVFFLLWLLCSLAPPLQPLLGSWTSPGDLFSGRVSFFLSHAFLDRFGRVVFFLPVIVSLASSEDGQSDCFDRCDWCGCC